MRRVFELGSLEKLMFLKKLFYTGLVILFVILSGVIDPLEVLSNRNNVFDGDEFDVNTTTNVDKSRIHKGKKKAAAKNANALLNDKKELAGMYFIH